MKAKRIRKRDFWNTCWFQTWIPKHSSRVHFIIQSHSHKTKPFAALLGTNPCFLPGMRSGHLPFSWCRAHGGIIGRFFSWHTKKNQLMLLWASLYMPKCFSPLLLWSMEHQVWMQPENNYRQFCMHIIACAIFCVQVKIPIEISVTPSVKFQWGRISMNWSIDQEFQFQGNAITGRKKSGWGFGTIIAETGKDWGKVCRGRQYGNIHLWAVEHHPFHFRRTCILSTLVFAFRITTFWQ